jgi:hypothetical protein
VDGSLHRPGRKRRIAKPFWNRGKAPLGGRPMRRKPSMRRTASRIGPTLLATTPPLGPSATHAPNAPTQRTNTASAELPTWRSRASR